MDFIEPLLLSAGYDSVLVIVDRLSKQAIFIPTQTTITSQGLASLFITHVFSKHGVPRHVTLDRGWEFTSHFFKSLGKALQMNLHFTTGYHPEGDSQMERVNQMLEQYLCMYCSYQQDDWVNFLPLAEFMYNNALNAMTGVSPFFANKGYHPDLSVLPELDLISPQAQDFVTNLEELHVELRRQVTEAQLRYQGPADARQITPPDFKVGDKVFMSTKTFRTTRPSPKLAKKYLGLFEIIA
jgi:hypothetical protein